MDKVVRIFEMLAAAEQADHKHWRHRCGEERLAAPLKLVLPKDPDEAVVERSARVDPLARPAKELNT